MNCPSPYWQSDCGRFTVYCADCRTILPHLTGVDAVVTDPPYGISNHEFRSTLPSTKSVVNTESIAADGDTDAAGYLFSFIKTDTDAVVWGANNFPHLLPHKGRWLCWDKRITEDADRMLGSAFELAWTSKMTGFDRMIRCLHGGVVNADGGSRLHPTQKPTKVMIACLEIFPDAITILDPFMGSGTTGVACVRLGRKFVGVEICEDYVKIAITRIERELAQGDFIRDAQPKPATQPELVTT